MLLGERDAVGTVGAIAKSLRISLDIPKRGRVACPLGLSALVAGAVLASHCWERRGRAGGKFCLFCLAAQRRVEGSATAICPERDRGRSNRAETANYQAKVGDAGLKVDGCWEPAGDGWRLEEEMDAGKGR